MNLRPFLLLLSYLLIASTGSSQAIQEAIELGATHLTLGMPKDVVVSRLAEAYNVEPASKADNDSWLIWSKGESRKRLVGNVSFRNGKLVWAVKQWTLSGQSQGAEFAKALYGVILEFARHGKKVCAIDAGETQSPKAEIRNVYITCGQKYISISIIRTPEHPEAATVEEVLDGRKRDEK